MQIPHFVVFFNFMSVPETSFIYPEPADTGMSFGGSRALFRAAAESFGVALSPQEDYDWLVILGAAMLVDHLVDVEHADISAPFASIMAGSLREDLNRDLQVRSINYLYRQTPSRQERISEQIAVVNELATRQRQASNPREVIAIRIAEADVLANILSLSTREDGTDCHPRHLFNNWLSSWSRVGYLIDSMIDLEEDYAGGASGVKPSWSARICFAKATAKESAIALKRTPPKLLSKCILNGLNYIIKQRRVTIKAA